MKRSVTRKNVTLLSEHIVASVDPHHRNEGKRLLIKEEAKFARRSERLAEVAGRRGSRPAAALAVCSASLS